MDKAKDVLAQAAGESQKSDAKVRAEQAPMTQADLDKQAQIKELQALAESEKAQRATRIYKNAVELDHDLYKLGPVHMKKDVSYTNQASYVSIEHCHIYHTINSGGKKQVSSTFTGGHFHMIEVVKPATEGVDGQPGNPPVLKVGPPIKHAWQRDKRTRQTKKITVPYDPGDNHSHPITYIRSEKIRPRKLNAEFVKFQGTQDARQNPKVTDVIG